jgi:hypothetical protein
VKHALGGEHSTPKLVGVRFSDVGGAEVFYRDAYGDAGVFMPEPPMRMRCMRIRSVASCS